MRDVAFDVADRAQQLGRAAHPAVVAHQPDVRARRRQAGARLATAAPSGACAPSISAGRRRRRRIAAREKAAAEARLRTRPRQTYRRILAETRRRRPPRACADGSARVGYGRARTSSKNIERARIPGLSQPEDRLLPHGRIPVGARHVDQLRHALVLRQLAEREHRAFLDLGVGIVLDGIGDRARRLPAGLLREPEDGLTAHGRAGVAPRDAGQRVDGLALRGSATPRTPGASARVSALDVSRSALRTSSNPVRPRAFAAQNAACLRVAIGLSGAISVASARSAAGSRWAAIACIAPSATRSRRSPSGTGRLASRSSRSMLADVLTPVSQ